MSAQHTNEIPIPLGAGQWDEARLHKELREITRGLATRLLTIEHDALSALRTCSSLGNLPLFGNARAGAWYVPPQTVPAAQTCSFKSADGHYGKWASSLRRPNAHVFAAAVESGGAVIVDVTRSGKKWPDSLTKTIPIWCTVLNAVVGLTSCTCGDVDSEKQTCFACIPLHLHPSVPETERAQILSQLPNWVRAWCRSGPSLHGVVPSFAEARKRRMKPLRALWVAPGRPIWESGVPLEQLEFTPIICVSASTPVPTGERAYVEPRTEDVEVCQVVFPKRRTGFSYVQGAGDDEEGWCQGLTPELFWLHRESLLRIAVGDGETEGAANVEVKLGAMVEEILSSTNPRVRNTLETRAKGAIGTPIWQSRILLAHAPTANLQNFTTLAANEFDGVIILGAKPPVEKQGDGEAKIVTFAGNPSIKWVPMTNDRGKVDYKYAFGRALGPCLAFLRSHCVDRGKEVLISCNSKSGDWSAGLAIAWLAWHCLSDINGIPRHHADEAHYTARLGEGEGYAVDKMRKESVGKIPKETIQATMLQFTSTYPQFQISRATLKQVNRFFSSPTPSSTVSEV